MSKNHETKKQCLPIQELYGEIPFFGSKKHLLNDGSERKFFMARKGVHFANSKQSLLKSNNNVVQGGGDA